MYIKFISHVKSYHNIIIFKSRQVANRFKKMWLVPFQQNIRRHLTKWKYNPFCDLNDNIWLLVWYFYNDHSYEKKKIKVLKTNVTHPNCVHCHIVKFHPLVWTLTIFLSNQFFPIFLSLNSMIKIWWLPTFGHQNGRVKLLVITWKTFGRSLQSFSHPIEGSLIFTINPMTTKI